MAAAVTEERNRRKMINKQYQQRMNDGKEDNMAIEKLMR
jgi:hypothetical protein